MFKAIALAVGMLVITHSAIADDRARLIGVWKLLSVENEFREGAPSRAIYGKNPTGYLILTAEGRMMAFIEGEGRKPAKNDEERSALLQSMIAYTGTYHVEGDKWITKVDASWNEAWNGTDQERHFRLDGDRLHVTSMWQPNLNLPGTPVSRGHLLWERVK